MVQLRNYKPLALMAADQDDLNVLSACLQDAVLKLGDFAWLSSTRRFAFVANRFVWECAPDRRRGPFARVRTGCHIDDVKSIRQQYLRTDAQDAVVDILAMRFLPGPDFADGENGAGTIMIDLAGGGAIALDVDTINIHMRDLSDPWTTRSKPDHKEQSGQ